MLTAHCSLPGGAGRAVARPRGGGGGAWGGFSSAHSRRHGQAAPPARHWLVDGDGVTTRCRNQSVHDGSDCARAVGWTHARIRIITRRGQRSEFLVCRPSVIRYISWRAVADPFRVLGDDHLHDIFPLACGPSTSLLFSAPATAVTTPPHITSREQNGAEQAQSNGAAEHTAGKSSSHHHVAPPRAAAHHVLPLPAAARPRPLRGRRPRRAGRRRRALHPRPLRALLRRVGLRHRPRRRRPDLYLPALRARAAGRIVELPSLLDALVPGRTGPGAAWWNWRQIVATGLAMLWTIRRECSSTPLPSLACRVAGALLPFAPFDAIRPPAVPLCLIPLAPDGSKTAVGSYLFKRVLSSGHDSRFEGIRDRPAAFAGAFAAQAAWVTLMLAPVIALNAVVPGTALAAGAAASTGVRVTDMLGLGTWIVGFGFEAVADAQKSRWAREKRDKVHDEAFMTSGLFSVRCVSPLPILLPPPLSGPACANRICAN
ncbi:hypothetical protein VFPFJ_04078 [Purpureocillium lilacinum]|uniref:Uncharacterized protein n=1 Tax=Purpureocillium lilacinum TaxID=33203 RepID=A0A179HRY0_PURLI|nr:hypothetical protein VFPFJ_04078 [Purpureocillium lilacinum]OAQ92338.1 hypothetical protein VFPFJ_04078 [Purpureocillium lilacinum]